ncbi:MAG: response regulator transcription factor [Verrucomicrobiae bacterium]|nr:response regulator transcription factor [Verrucomicrobiae bacterium]
MKTEFQPDIRVAIVEDIAELRRSLSELIGTAAGYCLCGAWPDAESALRGIPSTQPDVVLMDIELPGMDGVECVRRLKPMLPQARIMMLTVFGDQEPLFRALEAGASGYLIKKAPPERLLAAIRELHQGDSPMSPAVARFLVNWFQDRNATEAGATLPRVLPREPAAAVPDTYLTVREEEILKLIARGQRYKEIADGLGVSFDTVRTHVRNIFKKLHVNSKASAVRRYRALGNGDA